MSPLHMGIIMNAVHKTYNYWLEKDQPILFFLSISPWDILATIEPSSNWQQKKKKKKKEGGDAEKLG